MERLKLDEVKNVVVMEIFLQALVRKRIGIQEGVSSLGAVALERRLYRTRLPTVYRLSRRPEVQ